MQNNFGNILRRKYVKPIALRKELEELKGQLAQKESTAKSDGKPVNINGEVI